MGESDLDVLLRAAGATRQQLVHDARSRAVDIAGTIHDEIRRYRESIDEREQGDNARPVSRGPDEFTEEIGRLLGALRAELEVLIFAQNITLRDVTIDDVAPWDVTPYLTLAARAQRGARSAERTPDSPAPRTSARRALDITLNRVDRYVKGIATLFGHPLTDQGADQHEQQ